MPSCLLDRLEEQLRIAISELEAGAERLEELSRLAEETAAAKQAAEVAYGSAKMEEEEAANVVERGILSAAAAATAVSTNGTPAAAVEDLKGASGNNPAEGDELGRKSDAVKLEAGKVAASGSDEDR